MQLSTKTLTTYYKSFLPYELNGRKSTRRQDPTNCLASLMQRRISSFTKIKGQAHWWRLIKLEGNHSMCISYSASPHSPSPHRSVITHFLTVAFPSNFAGPTHMEGGRKLDKQILVLERRKTIQFRTPATSRLNYL